MAQTFDPPVLRQPFGAFSLGVAAGAGQTVYLKGQIALDPAGNVVAPGDMRTQTEQTLENIRAVLAHVGGVMGDIVSLTHYVTDIQQFMRTGDIRRRFFAPPYPVTTTVQVAALYRPEIVVEIAAIAEVARERFRAP